MKSTRIHRNSPVVRLPLDYSVTLERRLRQRERLKTFAEGLCWLALVAMLIVAWSVLESR